MLRSLTRRPRLPPFRAKTNLETGASGSPSKLPRRPPWTESMRPTTSIAIPRPRRRRPGRAAGWLRGAQVDRTFQRRSEQRGEGPRRGRRPNRPGRLRAANCRRVQIVLMCSWARNSVARQGRRRRRRCWRRRARGVTVARRAGKSPRLVAPLQRAGELRLRSRSEEQLETWKGSATVAVAARGSAKGALEPVRVEVTAKRFAAGRVEGEVGAVDVDADVAQVEGDAVDDVGDRVRAGGVDRDLGGVRD